MKTSKNKAAKQYAGWIGQKTSHAFKAYYVNQVHGDNKKRAWTKQHCETFEKTLMSAIMEVSLSKSRPDVASCQSPATVSKCSSVDRPTISLKNKTESPIYFGNKGGQGCNMILDVGELRSDNRDQPAWMIQTHGKVLQLRDGLRGRHMFNPKGNGRPSHFEGRCFEWRVIRGTNTTHFKVSGLQNSPPKWQLYEIEFSKPHGLLNLNPIVYQAGTPNKVWNVLFEKEGQAKTKNGIRLCGFEDMGIQNLLCFIQENEELGPPASISRRTIHFGTRMSVSDFKIRQQQALRAAAGEAFAKAIVSVCPAEPSEAFRLLWSSSRWRAVWAPKMEAEELLSMPFVLGIVQAHRRAKTKPEQRAILALFSPHFDIPTCVAMFEVTVYEVKQSRLQAMSIGAAVIAPKKVRKNRFLKGERARSFAYMYQWMRSRFACQVGDAHSSCLQRIDIRKRLLKKYEEMSWKQGIRPMKRTTFYEWFRDQLGFEDGKEKTCCCGSCVDGWTAFALLDEFIKLPELGLLPMAQQKFAARIQRCKQFYDGEYRWKHLQKSSTVSSHCMQFALRSIPRHKSKTKRDNEMALLAAFNCDCDHEHHRSCVDCNQMEVLYNDVASVVDTAIANKLVAAEDAPPDDKARLVAVAQERGEMWIEHIKGIKQEIERWVGHLVRKHASSRAPSVLKSFLGLQECFVTIDYKCKPLSRRNRELQGDSFGKRGKSLFGMVVVFLLANLLQYTQEGGSLPADLDVDVLGEYVVLRIRVCADDSDQSWWHSIQVFYTGLKLLKKKCSFLKKADLYCDGATNFKQVLFTFNLPQTGLAAGIAIENQIYPEAGDGKDDCDRDFNGCNILFSSWVKVDNRTMKNANEICDALEAGRGKGVINCALQIQPGQEKECESETKAFTALTGKAKENIFHCKFEYNSDGELAGYRFWTAFGFGKGQYVSAQELKEKVLGDKAPNVGTYTPIITRGTTLESCSPLCLSEAQFRDSKGDTKAQVC